MSKRQTTTARSSAEAEIYATDACVKDLLQIRLILQDLKLDKLFIPDKIPIFNDNMACVQWSKNKTSKGLRHVQIKENGVRENKKILDIQHCEGKTNISDLMTKENKNVSHFISIRDTTVPPPFFAKQVTVAQPTVKFNTTVITQTYRYNDTPNKTQKFEIPKKKIKYCEQKLECPRCL